MTNTIDIIIPKINFSGVSNTSQMLANYLRSEGWRVNFITLRGYDEKADILDQKVEFSNLSSNKILTSLWTLLKYMRANQSTPMMIWGKEYTVIGLIFKKILFLKNIIIGVNVNNIRLHIQRSSSLSYFAKNLLYKNTMKHADFWISQSGGIKDEMIADYNVQNNKTSVIYPAIQIPANANETKNRDEIIFVGRLTDQKNPILALRYAIKFLERNPTYFFRILGDGDLMPDMKKLASSSNVNGRIIFEGFVKNTSDYITGTKAMILTSRYEGFGMVIVESIFTGVPVISIDCPSGPREIIQDDINGYLVTSQNNFIDKLTQATSKKWDKDQMVKSIEKFHPEKILSQYKDILLEIVYQ